MAGRTDPSLRGELESGLLQLGLACRSEQIDALLSYLELLNKWNQAFNLSGIRDPSRMVGLHLLDSLAISPFLTGNLVLDAGTGAGLPGIPLAILNPQRRFILLDSNGKKTRFLFQVKTALGLDNVQIENRRLEHYHCGEQIDIVLSRAFASLARLARLCSDAIGAQGILLAMKGTYPESEIAELPEPFAVARATALQVPGVMGSRYLIEIPLGGPATPASAIS